MIKKYCEVYAHYDGNKPFYVRFCPLETDDLPHGLSFGTRFSTRKEAENFAVKIDRYIDKFLEIELNASDRPESDIQDEHLSDIEEGF